MIRPLGPRLKTSWFDKVMRDPPLVIVWSPITIVVAPTGTVTSVPSILNVDGLGGGVPKVGSANAFDDLPSVPTTTTAVGARLKTEPPTVTGGPLKNAVLVPMTTLVAPGAAEMTVLPIVAIGTGAIVGLGMNELEPDTEEM